MFRTIFNKAVPQERQERVLLHGNFPSFVDPPPPHHVYIWMHLVNGTGNSPSLGQPTVE